MNLSLFLFCNVSLYFQKYALVCYFRLLLLCLAMIFFFFSLLLSISRTTLSYLLITPLLRDDSPITLLNALYSARSLHSSWWTHKMIPSHVKALGIVGLCCPMVCLSHVLGSLYSHRCRSVLCVKLCVQAGLNGQDTPRHTSGHT